MKYLTKLNLVGIMKNRKLPTKGHIKNGYIKYD